MMKINDTHSSIYFIIIKSIVFFRYDDDDVNDYRVCNLVST